MERSCSCFGFAVFLKEKGWWHIRHYWDDWEEGQLGNTRTGRGQPWGNSPSPELARRHPESVSEIFGCKRERFVPERGTLFSDVTVFILSSVQDLCASFWAWSKFHAQAWSPCPPATQTMGALPAGLCTAECCRVIPDSWPQVGKWDELLSSATPCTRTIILGFSDDWLWCSLTSNTWWGA